jgi:hypothetical protein
MSEDAWTEKSREELRERLRSAIRGELRLARSDHQGILDYCRDVWMQDVCPADEWDAFLRFEREEIDRLAVERAAEMSSWPDETDCDRLDRVEVALRERGILFWQVSPCCDTCTGGELPDRIAVINDRHPGFRDRVRGYAFFIDQNMPEMLAESLRISIYLGYGCFTQDDSQAEPDVYNKGALGFAREVCECLHEEGLEVDWDGDFGRKICVSVNWRRRTVLE